MNRVERIQNIYKMRVELARREAGAAQQLRLTHENDHAGMGARLKEELDGCDSIERAPFDFAARYHRATISQMRVKQEEIDAAAVREIAASDYLRERYKEQREFDIYAQRRQSEHDDRIRQKENEASRQYFEGRTGEAMLTENWE